MGPTSKLLEVGSLTESLETAAHRQSEKKGYRRRGASNTQEGFRQSNKEIHIPPNASPSPWICETRTSISRREGKEKMKGALGFK